ncbi:MAG: hypothetical protein CMJ25_13525 [Phycisphaerae bacterium]|nr:hypothetical protein [Phycisphaerae bacterium]
MENNMSVHQVHEFYVHLKIQDKDIDKVKKFCLNECWDFEIHDGELTVDCFDAEYEAEKCEQMVVGVLSC